MAEAKQDLVWEKALELDELAEGRVVNRVEVPADIAKHARVALERMRSVK